MQAFDCLDTSSSFLLSIQICIQICIKDRFIRGTIVYSTQGNLMYGRKLSAVLYGKKNEKKRL